MAVFLWTIRSLATTFLGLIVVVAFLGWLASSTLVSDLNSKDSQVVRLAGLMETVEHPDAVVFRREIRESRDEVKRELTLVRTFLLLSTIVGLAVIGLIHLPDGVASLRWPGYTLLLTGVVALVLVWLAQATLPDIVGRMPDHQASEGAAAAVTELLGGAVTPCLWAVLTGAALVVASLFLGRWQRQRVNSSLAKAGCQ